MLKRKTELRVQPGSSEPPHLPPAGYPTTPALEPPGGTEPYDPRPRWLISSGFLLSCVLTHDQKIGRSNAYTFFFLIDEDTHTGKKNKPYKIQSEQGQNLAFTFKNGLIKSL